MAVSLVCRSAHKCWTCAVNESRFASFLLVNTCGENILCLSYPFFHKIWGCMFKGRHEAFGFCAHRASGSKIQVPCKNLHVFGQYMNKPCKGDLYSSENKHVLGQKNLLPTWACNHTILCTRDKIYKPSACRHALTHWGHDKMAAIF